jgi:hypothetical protein
LIRLMNLNLLATTAAVGTHSTCDKPLLRFVAENELKFHSLTMMRQGLAAVNRSIGHRGTPTSPFRLRDLGEREGSRGRGRTKRRTADSSSPSRPVAEVDLGRGSDRLSRFFARPAPGPTGPDLLGPSLADPIGSAGPGRSAPGADRTGGRPRPGSRPASTR